MDVLVESDYDRQLASIAAVPACVASGLSHPGVIALPLSNGPPVRTRRVWRSDDNNPIVGSLVDLATAWSGNGRANQGGP